MCTNQEENRIYRVFTVVLCLCFPLDGLSVVSLVAFDPCGDIVLLKSLATGFADVVLLSSIAT